ncbi:unnamed protein product [Notodromas monacha]|uniref:Protein O-mannosyl-transferase 2 n=1 Tax=Notodromas monacha TaxID=399045 RepID=A0A7R9GES8_9CRUS|nr:unnamed protein product [Notodromas monacha]CAG0918175.1 unnamed protein product [Notodromas monacha]
MVPGIETRSNRRLIVLIGYFLGMNSCGTWWWIIFAVLIAASLGTRLYKVDEPRHVCWDETHFGKMASWYINRTFFFDVHPPLGKMLIAASGYLTGYDGKFAFNKPGDVYGNTSYVGMRVACAVLGATLTPMTFITSWEMTKSLSAASLSGTLVLFDFGVLTLTQYILLDSYLMFFIVAAVMCLEKFLSYRESPFSVFWWSWMLLTGTCLACAFAVKFVGLFVVLYVGVRTAWDLWEILGDVGKPFVYTMRHFVARTLCLIAWPAALYVLFFYIHLQVLSKTGNGDGHFSSAFQSTLEGNPLHNASMPGELAFGAEITIKNNRVGGAYLHSHFHLYPVGVGARQQQVTTYSHKDPNNVWVVKPYDAPIPPLNGTDEIELVKNGDLIRLEHKLTRRNLHAHKVAAPLSRKHYQVTGYGENGTGDANDIWKIEIYGKSTGGDVIHPVRTTFRLIHYITGCGLFSHNKNLPRWGFEQMEVTCNPNLRNDNNRWNIEEINFPRMPNVSMEMYKPSFFEKFVEAHAVMLQGNAGLKPKPGEAYAKPWQWPIDFRGQWFSAVDSLHIYLLGNPVIWWGNIVLLGVFLCCLFLNAVKAQRGIEESPSESARKRQINWACLWLFVGWSLHYLPFWGMGRILYYHHYFPALHFSTMISALTVDYSLQTVCAMLPNRYASGLVHWTLGVIVAVVAYRCLADHIANKATSTSQKEVIIENSLVSRAFVKVTEGIDMSSESESSGSELIVSVDASVENVEELPESEPEWETESSVNRVGSEFITSPKEPCFSAEIGEECSKTTYSPNPIEVTESSVVPNKERSTSPVGLGLCRRIYSDDSWDEEMPLPNALPRGPAVSSVKPVLGKCVLVDRRTFRVDMGFHEKAIEEFKSIPSRIYDMTSKRWSFALTDHVKLMSKLNALRPHVAVAEIPKHVVEVSSLIAHFLANAEKPRVPNISLGAVEPYLASSLMPFQKDGVRYNWAHDVTRWMPSLLAADVCVIDSKKAIPSDAKVILISYDLFARRVEEFKNLQKPIGIAIMDEAHMLKNGKTIRAKAARQLLKNVKRIILLTGTPALSRPMELFTQLQLLNCRTFGNFQAFGIRYCDGKKTPFGWDFSGSSHMAELQMLLEDTVMIRRLKKEVLEQLPAKERQVVLLDPSTIEKPTKAMNSLVSQMNNCKIKGMERRGKLLEYFHETGRVKLRAAWGMPVPHIVDCLDYVMDLVESENKFLCFAHHAHVLDGLSETLRKKNIDFIRIDGRTSSDLRRAYCEAFQTREECRVALLSITAAGVGLTLTSANLVVFTELYWNPGILTQAEDRAHRIGQQDCVFIQYLVAAGTADDHLWPMIQQKLDVLSKAGLSKDNFKEADFIEAPAKDRGIASFFETIVEDLNESKNQE